MPRGRLRAILKERVKEIQKHLAIDWVRQMVMRWVKLTHWEIAMGLLMGFLKEKHWVMHSVKEMRMVIEMDLRSDWLKERRN